MTGPNKQLDAAFFQLIHDLVMASPRESNEDRRRRPRQTFRSRQRIAPRLGDALPGEDEFFAVQCHDLTRAGFSFFLPTSPSFSSLVAAFGTGPETLYVAAEVQRVADVLVAPSGDILYPSNFLCGKPGDLQLEPLTLVGCKFTSRIEPEWIEPTQ